MTIAAVCVLHSVTVQKLPHQFHTVSCHPKGDITKWTVFAWMWKAYSNDVSFLEQHIMKYEVSFLSMTGAHYITRCYRWNNK